MIMEEPPAGIVSAAEVSKTAHAVPMTTQPLACPAPVLTADFDSCRVPGGLDLWQNWGYYSPGVCFIGYVALCTQTAAPSGRWPISQDETAVRCVPVGYECNDKTSDQRYATSLYNDMTLSAPAFEIRWRSGDVNGQFTQPPPPAPSRSTTSSQIESSSGPLASPPTPSETTTRKAGGDMSSGTVAGIVIGAGLAMCAVVGGAVLIRARRRKHVAAKAQQLNAKPGGGGDAAELGPAAPLAELQSEQVAKELASNRPKQYDDYAAVNREPAELPGDLFRSSHN